jgi:hypothetical protein
MYSSFVTANCTKCGELLTYLTTKDGKRMAISEGTLYPILGSRKAKDAEQTNARKGGLHPVYRFKIFSFADGNAPLVIPEAHMHCNKSAMVKITIVNHQPIYSYFQGKDQMHHVEVMLPVYPAFGDSIQLIQEPKEQATYEDKVPQGMDPAAELAMLKQRVAAAEKRIAESNTALVVTEVEPVEGVQEPIVAGSPLMDYQDDFPQAELDPTLFDGGDGQAEYAESIKETLGPETAVATADPFPTKA